MCIRDSLCAMDIYCLPSVYGEFFPNSILEAMAAKLPWLGSDIAGLKELTANSQAGLVSPKGDLEKLTNNLDLLCSDEDLRLKMGEKGRKEVTERFTIEAVSNRIYEAYNQSQNCFL